MKCRLERQGFAQAIAISVIAVVLLANMAVAAETSKVDVMIQRVALFKNGLGFFVSSATLPGGATAVELNQIPVPTYGSFWLSYPRDLGLRSLVSSIDSVGDDTEARSIIDLLRANVGRQVSISAGPCDEAEVVGRIVSVLDEEGGRNSAPVVLNTADGVVALNATAIYRVDFGSDSIVTTLPSFSPRSKLRLELNKAAGGEQFGVTYLARGITWSPSYLIDISDPDSAIVSAKSIVINEAADLDGIHLDLVSGYPNIKFGSISSPVAMSQNLAGLLRSLSSSGSDFNIRGGRSGDLLMNQMALGSSLSFEDESAGFMPDYSAGDQGAVAEDLYLYPVDDFSLRKGETATIPLFSRAMPYRHIYTWEIPNLLDERNRSYYFGGENERPQAEEIWHSCRLTNIMEMPLTTAPAEFVSSEQFTGQDICYYTAPGAETTIRINRAMNIIAEKVETEQERERDAATFNGSHYDLVTVRGELKLTNRMAKSATVEVTKKVTGEIIESVPTAKDVRTAKGLQMVNSRHDLVWEIELKPGEERLITFIYQVYILN